MYVELTTLHRRVAVKMLVPIRLQLPYTIDVPGPRVIKGLKLFTA